MYMAWILGKRGRKKGPLGGGPDLENSRLVRKPSLPEM
jgi:hypothetical protein